MSAEDEIKRIEEEISKTKYHKGTERHIGILKAKVAKLKEKAASAKKAGGGKGFSVRKEGDGTVVMVGFPSVGKSTILNAITSAKSEIAPWEFTTKDAIPGMMEHNGALIQVVDIPGIITGAAEGKGRGKEVLSAVRVSDLILIIAEVDKVDRIREIVDELEKGNVRLDKRPPRIWIERKESGSLSVLGVPGLSLETIKEVCKTFGIVNADLVFRERVSVDQLIDFLTGRCVYLKSLIILNKIDKLEKKKVEELEKLIRKTYMKEVLSISAENKANIDTLKDKIYERLDLIQVYTKRKEGKELGEPMIIKRGSTVRNVCDKIHRDIRKKFKYALVTGKSVKFQNQRVGLGHLVQDQDVITVITER